LTIKTTLRQKVKPETEKTKNHKFYEYRYNNPLSIMNSMAKIIEANNLTKIYGEKETSVTALDDINIEFRENEFTAIMGPSGSGKSTLLHCLAGLDRPSSGKIFLKGNDIATLNDKELTKIRRDSFGFIFQAFNLIPTLTAEENITLPASIAGRQPDMEWVKEVVETVDIADRLSHRPNELSGGQQQRVAAARAMATKPEVIFADEPSGNLDSKSSRELLTFMKSVVEELNQTIVMVTHDPYAASFAGRVVMLKDGKIASDLEKPTQEEIVAEVTALTNV
jgi:putative ABC transport system ATP-binding protein